MSGNETAKMAIKLKAARTRTHFIALFAVCFFQMKKVFVLTVVKYRRRFDIPLSWENQTLKLMAGA
jgi:hypothetical protein